MVDCGACGRCEWLASLPHYSLAGRHRKEAGPCTQ